MKQLFISILILLSLSYLANLQVFAAELLKVIPLETPHVCGSEMVDTAARASLTGNGYGCLEGTGIVAVRLDRGLVGVNGSGILVFKADTYELDGDWKDGVQDVMGWSFVMGRGSYLARGSDSHEIVGWLTDARVKYRGALTSTFEGAWESVSEKLSPTTEEVSLSPFSE